MRRSTAFAVVLLAAWPGFIAPSQAATETAHRQHRAHHRAVQTQPLIACTVLGCAPVRPECGSAPGRTWSGMPTGHDVVICPPGVAPFR